jgi:hypothetical protein
MTKLSGKTALVTGALGGLVRHGTAPRNVAIVALANKLARIALAVLRRGNRFDARAMSMAA